MGVSSLELALLLFGRWMAPSRHVCQLSSRQPWAAGPVSLAAAGV
jgi:hypothetical protein